MSCFSVLPCACLLPSSKCNKHLLWAGQYLRGIVINKGDKSLVPRSLHLMGETDDKPRNVWAGNKCNEENKTGKAGQENINRSGFSGQQGKKINCFTLIPYESSYIVMVISILNLTSPQKDYSLLLYLCPSFCQTCFASRFPIVQVDRIRIHSGPFRTKIQVLSLISCFTHFLRLTGTEFCWFIHFSVPRCYHQLKPLWS